MDCTIRQFEYSLVTEHNPESPGERLLTGPPTLCDIHQIFSMETPEDIEYYHSTTP